MRWLNVPDDTITKLALQVLQTKTDSTGHKTFITLPKFVPKELPPKSKPIHEWADYKALEPGGIDKDLFKVLEYIAARKLNLNDYDFYWTPEAGYRDRLIIPFRYEGRIVGYTARTVGDNRVKYLTDSQPGFVFNLDEQGHNKVFTILCEGPIDALHVDGCALTGSDINDAQALLLNRLGKDIYVVPDRDRAGAKLVEQAIDQGWHVSMPEWESGINDIGDAVSKYGRLYTLYSIANSAESSPLKIRLRAKKWFT